MREIYYILHYIFKLSSGSLLKTSTLLANSCITLHYAALLTRHYRGNSRISFSLHTHKENLHSFACLLGLIYTHYLYFLFAHQWHSFSISKVQRIYIGINMVVPRENSNLLRIPIHDVISQDSICYSRG